VIEMDAASNRGIDEIRELRERTRYASAESRFKVYVIDEAHMLTTEACNAFLKTLEEPPRDVVFVLATTDPSRLPSTIVSRCQRFDFHLLTVEQIQNRLEHIIGLENWQADGEAIRLIARLADGSLRDALGILEQCAAYAEDRVTAKQVRIVTGATRTETIEQLIKAIVENDPSSGFAALKQVIYSGRDLQLLMRDITFVFSRLLLSGETSKGQTDEEEHGLAGLVDNYRGKIPGHILLEMVELIHQINSELRHAHFPQYILEVSFIRLLRLLHGQARSSPAVSGGESLPDAGGAEKEINEAGRSREKQYPMKNAEVAGEAVGDSRGSGFRGPDPGNKISAEKSESKETPVTGEDGGSSADGKPHAGAENGADSLAKLKAAWPRILEELKKKQKSTAAWLEPATVEDFRGELVCLSYPAEYAIHQMRLMEDNHRKLVEEVFAAFCRMPVRVKAEIAENNKGKSDTFSGHENSLSTGPAYNNSSPQDFTGGENNNQKETAAGEQVPPAGDEGQTGGPEHEEEQPAREGKNEIAREKEKNAPGAEDALEFFEGDLIDPE